MEESSSGSGFGALLGSIVTTLFNLVVEMLGAFFGILPKVLSFTLWVIAALFILPCVFISNILYPKWVEWGENF